MKPKRTDRPRGRLLTPDERPPEQDRLTKSGRLKIAGVVDTGGIESSRYLEAMCMVWVLAGMKRASWTHAFKL